MTEPVAKSHFLGGAGTITQVDTKAHTITVKAEDGTLTTFDFSKDVVVTEPGVVKGTDSTAREGDKVMVHYSEDVERRSSASASIREPSATFTSDQHAGTPSPHNHAEPSVKVPRFRLSSLMLGVLTIGTSCLLAVDSPASPNRTQIKLLTPFDRGALRVAMAVTEKVEGSCFAPSAASPSRPDAWRCHAGTPSMIPVTRASQVTARKSHARWVAPGVGMSSC